MSNKEKTLYLIGNAHIDPVWLGRADEGMHEAHAIFRAALDLMNEYAEFTFTASSAAFYASIEENDPQMFLAHSKRWCRAGETSQFAQRARTNPAGMMNH